MRHLILLLCCICSGGLSSGQDYSDYRSIDNDILRIPSAQSNSTADIAEYIKAHFDNEPGRVRAIYTWVISNLKYDKDSANIINSDLNPEARITVALRRRRGVCENFAAIFNDICSRSGLTSYVVSGYTKQSGTVDRTGHSWCAVSVNKSWYLFDPTWDEGSGFNSRYFLVPLSEFIGSHMPFDPLWQLLEFPISHEQFYRGNLSKGNATPYFNFRDSVAAFLLMDSLHRLQSAASRIQKFQIYNPLVKDNYNYIKMHIEMIDQDRDIELYNSSMADLNDATMILNTFIEYRNNQFTPEKNDAELQAMLDDIDSKMDSSLKKLDEVDRSKATLMLGTDPVRERLNILKKKITDQKEFLKRYLGTEKSSRKSLFY